jgi:invasion protein IalB
MTRSFALLLLITALAINSLEAAASDPRATQLTYGPWMKVCIAGAHCVVGTETRGKCNPSGGSVAILIPQEQPWGLSVALGTRGLEGEISVLIDQGDRITIPAGPCYASGCMGKLDIDDQFVERLKRSQKITIEATDTSGQKLSLSFSLAGFAQAFDGPGTEPKVKEVIITSKEMKERLEKEEEEAEKNKPSWCEK